MKKSKSLQEDLDTAREEYDKWRDNLIRKQKNELDEITEKHWRSESNTRDYYYKEINEKRDEISKLTKRVVELPMYHIVVALVTVICLFLTKSLRDDFVNVVKVIWQGICKAAIYTHSHGIVVDILAVLLILFFIWFMFVFEIKKWNMSIFDKAFSWWDEHMSSVINVASLIVFASGNWIKGFWNINIVCLWLIVAALLIIYRILRRYSRIDWDSVWYYTISGGITIGSVAGILWCVHHFF